MAKIVCFPSIPDYHAARDRSFYLDLSQMKGRPCFALIFTLNHNSHDYAGLPNNHYHYSAFHVNFQGEHKYLNSDIRQSLIDGNMLSDEDFVKIEKNHASVFSQADFYENRFFVHNPLDLEDAISMMQETKPVQNADEVRQTILEYVTPFLDSSLKPLRIPHTLL